MSIQNYVEDYCQTYSLNYDCYFDFYNEKTNSGKKVPFVKNGKINIELIKYASMVLGISFTDIVTKNKDAFMKWYNKYSFFKYKPLYDYEFIKSYYGDGYDEARMLEVIFNQPIPKPVKYDYQNVVERLYSSLKEVNRYLPGTYHEGATITNLYISTDNLFHFEDIGKMMKSYFEMLNRFEILFFKSLKEDLLEEEINEYNFLASFFVVKDTVSNKQLYYQILVELRDVYLAEGSEDLLAFVKLDHNSTFEPWRCAEFIMNKEYVQKFVDYYPFAKNKLNEFANMVQNFKCFYAWSDSKPIQFEDENLWGESNSIVPIEECAKEPSPYYVPKTHEEMSGDEIFISYLQQLASPPKLGGIVKRNIDSRMNQFDKLLAISKKSIHVFKLEDFDNPSCYVRYSKNLLKEKKHG